MLAPPIPLPASAATIARVRFRAFFRAFSLRPLPAAPVSCAPCKIPRPPITRRKTPNTGSSPPYPAHFRRSSFHIQPSVIPRLRSYFYIRSSRIHGSVRHAHSAGTARHASISRPFPPPGILIFSHLFISPFQYPFIFDMRLRSPCSLRRHAPPAADTPTDTIPDFPPNRSP